jgi:Na+/H+ antiporter NhaC
MLNEWVLLGKFDNNLYFIIIIIIIFLFSSFGRSKPKRNVHVNGKTEIGEDLLLKKQLKDDVDF